MYKRQFQNSRLIKASILENVRMGKPNATREEIMAALHNAQCDDILEKPVSYTHLDVYKRQMC